MVVEFLTFTIDPSERAAWLPIEERSWSRFLERQNGFISKQLWMERDRPDEVYAVIFWESEALWHAIPKEELAAVDASMGGWLRDPTCRTYEVIRDC